MVGVLFLIGVEDVGGLKTGLGLDPSLTGACGLTLWVGDSPTQFVSESVIQLEASSPPCQWRIQTWGEGRGAEMFLIGDGSRKLVCLGVFIRGGAKELEHSF